MYVCELILTRGFGKAKCYFDDTNLIDVVIINC